MKRFFIALSLLLAVFAVSFQTQEAQAQDTVVVGQPYGYGPYGGYGYGGGGYGAYGYPRPYYSPNPALQRPYSVGNPFYLNRYVGGNTVRAREVLSMPNPVNDNSDYYY